MQSPQESLPGARLPHLTLLALARRHRFGEAPPSNIPISATTERFFKKLDKKSIVNHRLKLFPALKTVQKRRRKKLNAFC